jgi:hypothetical protein
MKRHLMTLLLSGFVVSSVLNGNAEACHKKKCTCAVPAPCAVVEPVPCPPPPPPPVCAPMPKRCCGGGMFAGFGGMFTGFKGLGCHKKFAVVAAAPCPEPVAYAAPAAYYAAPVTYPSPQASPQR